MGVQSQVLPTCLASRRCGRAQGPQQLRLITSGRAVDQVSGLVGLDVVVVVVVVAASPRPSVIAGLAAVGLLKRPLSLFDWLLDLLALL